MAAEEAAKVAGPLGAGAAAVVAVIHAWVLKGHKDKAAKEKAHRASIVR